MAPTAGGVVTPGDQSPARYAAVAIVLHWTIAFAILMQLSLGLRMDGPFTAERFAVIQLHKSVGITILLLSLIRVGWRLGTPRPPPVRGLPEWQRRFAAVAHTGLYAAMILLPLSGWLMVSASPLAIPTRLFGGIPWPHMAGVDLLPIATRKVVLIASRNAHMSMSWMLWALVLLHIGGALKHQFGPRSEPVLARMAPGARPGRWLDARLGGIAAAAVLALCLGAALPFRPAPSRTVEPDPPSVAPTPLPQPIQPPLDHPTPPRTPDRPVAWRVVEGSDVRFATAWNGEPINGRFTRWSARILFDPESLSAAEATVRIDMASADTGDPQRDTALPSEDWFDVEQHPTASFTSNRFEHLSANRYRARGVLDIRGVRRPLTLPFTLVIEGRRARMQAEIELDRTAFGIGPADWSEQVPAAVRVNVDLRAERTTGLTEPVPTTGVSKSPAPDLNSILVSGG